MKFLWTTILVNDIEASVRFYEDMAGLKEVRRVTPPKGSVLVFLADGETQVELIYDPGAVIEPYAHTPSIAFKVDSVEKMIEKVKAAGYEMSSEVITPNPHIKFFFVRDPMGVRVQFAELHN